MDGSPVDNLDLGTRGDAQTLEQAVRQRWPISEEHREMVVLSVLNAIKHCDPSKARTLAALSRTVAMLERQNQADEHKLRPDRQLNVSINPDQLANMSDEELEALERRLLGKDT